MSVYSIMDCASCLHSDVCKLKDDFLKTQEAVNDVMVLRDMEWINVNLKCVHYNYSSGGTIR